MTTTVIPVSTTELEAVNTMLLIIGESPVSSLETTSIDDAVIARQILGEQMRTIQSEGWHFNTEDNYPLSPEVITGYISLPTNLCSWDLNIYRHPTSDVTVRGSKLYDKVNRTFSFSETLYGRACLLLPFTDMPEVLRHYTTIKAGRIFSDRMVGDGELNGFTRLDEARARTICIEEQADRDDLNILTDDMEIMTTVRYGRRGRSLTWS